MRFLALLMASFLITGCTEKDVMQNRNQDQEKNHHMANQSKIITVDKIEDVETELKKADENTLVVFDCDGVLTIVSSPIVVKSNRKAFLELYNKEFPNFSHEQFFDHLSQIVAFCANILVSKEMPELTDDLQQRNIKTIVLTGFSTKASRNFPDPMKWRIDTLKSLGYHFEKSFPSLTRCSLNMPNNQPNSEYNQGIIFCNGGRKDDSLKAFLAYAGYRPSKIIFIDDNIGNVQNIGILCKNHHIDFVGIEYTESDKMKNSASPFPTKRIEFQLKKFHETGLWISAEEAEKEVSR
jgi:hypothetical protein